MKNGYQSFLTAAGLAIAATCLFVAPALGQDSTDDECVAACREDLANCRFDARETSAQCLEEAGCDVLRDTYRETCLVADRDEEACDAARQALRDCVEPCRTALREDGDTCRQNLETCLTDECGLEDLPPARRHHGHGGRGLRR